MTFEITIQSFSEYITLTDTLEKQIVLIRYYRKCMTSKL